MKTEAEIRHALRQWIVDKTGRVSRNDLSDTTPIVEHRIITSLQIMDLLLFVEKLSGKPIDVEDLKPGAFKDVDTIYERFFEGGTDGR